MPAPGLYGRRAPDLTRPALRLGNYLTGAVPAHPAAVDYLARLSSWQMLGNDAYGDCVSPDMRVLTADLRWVPAGDLVPGDKLLGFEENPSGRGIGRRYCVSEVETADIIKRPCYELEFEDGTVVRCSEGHRWLTRSTEQGRLGTQVWVEARQLRTGPLRTSRVVKPLDVWDADHTFEAGYVAAAFDGEGNLDQRADKRKSQVFTNRLSFAQVDNPMLAEVERCLKEIGFDYTHASQERGGNACADGSQRQTIHRLTVGKRSQLLRFLGSVRPSRLLPKFDSSALGRINGDVVKLVRKTHIGEQDVVYLNTTSRTYFAEGLASHNCVAVTWANVRRLVTAVLSTEYYPSLDQVYAVYETQNPGFPQQDNGMDIQTCLQYLVKHRRAGRGEGARVRQGRLHQPGRGEGGHRHLRQRLDRAQRPAGPGDPVQRRASRGTGCPGRRIDGGHSVVTGGYGESAGRAAGGG